MEITHLGSGICSHNCRMTGAILFETRPAIMIRSLCRGDGRNTSAPKRAISKRAAPIDIISIAQQARPNVIGQMELLRIQFTAESSVEHDPLRSGIAEGKILNRPLAILDINVRSEVQFAGHSVFISPAVHSTRCTQFCSTVPWSKPLDTTTGWDKLGESFPSAGLFRPFLQLTIQVRIPG